jgi:hypothetical protein
MKNLILISVKIIFLVIISGCASSITFKTPVIKQPITLSKIIGIDSLVVPSSAISIGMIETGVFYESTQSHAGPYIVKTERESGDPQVDFNYVLKNDNHRFVNNLQFHIISYNMLSGIERRIECLGNIYELNEKTK